MTNIKQKLLEAIESAPEPALNEVLHYLEYLMNRQLEELEDAQDLANYRAAKAEEGDAVSLSELKQELSPKE